LAGLGEQLPEEQVEEEGPGRRPQQPLGQRAVSGDGPGGRGQELVRRIAAPG